MSAETLRIYLWILLAVFQVLVVFCGLGIKFADRLVSKQSSESLRSHIDSRFDHIEALGISSQIAFAPEKKNSEELLQQLSFQEVEQLLNELRVQRKLLQDAFERTSQDGDYVRDLSTRLDCLIGTDDGLLYLVMQKIGIGLSCFNKFDPEKKRYELKEFFKHKNYKASVDGKESAYSVQDIIHLMAKKDGGSQLDLTKDKAFLRLTKGVNFGSHDAGTYILLRTAKQLFGDIDQILDISNKYYITPNKLIIRGDSLKCQGDYDGAIVVFNEAKKILSEFRLPNAPDLIQVEGHLSAVYYIKDDYSLSLQHAETACSLLGDKEWTGNLAPMCTEGVAFSLLKLNLPSVTEEAKAVYFRSIDLLNEAIRLKRVNASYEHTPLHLDHGALALAYLFTGDFVSSVASAKDAREEHSCQAYATIEGLAFLGLEKYSEANDLFRSIKSSRGLSTGLINYANELASNKGTFSLQDAWFFYSSSRLEDQDQKDPSKMRLDGF